MTQQITPERFSEWKQKAFEGLTRDELKLAAEIVGVEYAPQTNTETLRKKLQDAIGLVSAPLTDKQVTDIAADAPKAGQAKVSLTSNPPNLGAAGRWGGRYRRVRLTKTDFYQKFNAFPLTWEGQTLYFHFDIEVDMPWPYYEVLKNMRETRITQKLSADGKSVVKNETTHQVMPFSDHGDTPGTAHLPCSMIEYVQAVAKSCNHFADTPRRDLIRVMRWLHGPQANVAMKDLSDDDIRDQLLTFIGVDIYADA